MVALCYCYRWLSSVSVNGNIAMWNSIFGLAYTLAMPVYGSAPILGVSTSVCHKKFRVHDLRLEYSFLFGKST